MNKTKFQRNDYVFVAHNGSAYDLQFIYRSTHDFFGSKNVKVLLHMNRMIESRIQVHRGSRLSSIYFKDSYKLINLPLHLLPKSFGFHNDLQKGFFPHLLNMKENMNYESAKLPDIKFFDADSMNEEDRRRCERWHRKESSRMKSQGGLYNLRSEMLKYCYDDCFMLSTTFIHFNESMVCELKQSGVTGITDHELRY